METLEFFFFQKIANGVQDGGHFLQDDAIIHTLSSLKF